MKFQNDKNDNMYRISSIGLAILFLGLMSASNTHAETYSLVKQWGSFGAGNGQLYYPTGITVDSSGNVYVVDANNNRIEKFDSNGNYLTQWGSPGNGNGQFNNPNGIKVDSSGNVYVVDYSNGRIQKFNSNGNFIAQYGAGQLGGPNDLVVDLSGNIYVSEFAGCRIDKFDRNGNFITKWGSWGPGNGSFEGPSGIAVDSSGNVYSADIYDNCIQKFDSNGNFITKWGPWTNGNERSCQLSGVAVDSSSNVYVTDSYNGRIEIFDGNGNYITHFGNNIGWVVGVALDTSGNIYVTDKLGNRILKYARGITSSITWNNPADITYGTPLSSTQLNAIASVPGTYVYTPAAGTVLSAGTHILHVDFTPLDSVNYTNASTEVTINVRTVLPIPVAAFSATPTSGNSPLNVAFTDQSSGSPTSWSWNFGDGSASTDQNPSHVYTTAGTFNVKLIAGNDAGNDTSTKQIDVMMSSSSVTPPDATSTPTSAFTPITTPVPTPTFTPTSTEQPSVSVNLYGEKTDVIKGEDIQLKLSAVNIITKPTMHTQVILIPPSGMSVSSSDFVESGAGQYTATFDLEPGNGKDIEVKIAANQVGNFDVKGTVVYYFGSSKKDAISKDLDLPIHVSDATPPTTSLPSTTSTPRTFIVTPGFGAVSLIFMVLMVFLIRRRI